MKIYISLLSLFLMQFLTFEALAATQYRCNGRVQYRPCIGKVPASSAYRALNQSQQNLLKASFNYQKQMAEATKGAFADVVSSSYRKMPRQNSRNYGQWRGIVRGNGDIHLRLQIERNGVQTDRYMGRVKLNQDQTSFNFISTPPKEKNWTWKVLAVAK